MTIERWGSLSVNDHVDTASLAANVLLYDRLVIPAMATQDDRDERGYWLDRGWDPDLQRKRIDQLEELAVVRPWNAARRAAYANRLAEVRGEQSNVDAYGITRSTLAHELVLHKPPGVQHADVVAAYNSGAALARDFTLDNAREHVAAQAVLLCRRLALPDLGDPEQTLKLARALSRDPSFKLKRAALFDWQQTAVLRGLAPDAAVGLVAEMTDDYNAAVLAATRKVVWKLAFTVCGIGLGFATGGLGAAAASAALSLVQFATLDKDPVIEAGRATPAAMFHDIEARVGFKLKPA